jgi:hypothetical protein
VADEVTDIHEGVAARFHPELMRPSDDEEEVRMLGYGYFDEVEVRRVVALAFP